LFLNQEEVTFDPMFKVYANMCIGKMIQFVSQYRLYEYFYRIYLKIRTNRQKKKKEKKRMQSIRLIKVFTVMQAQVLHNKLSLLSMNGHIQTCK